MTETENIGRAAEAPIEAYWNRAANQPGVSLPHATLDRLDALPQVRALPEAITFFKDVSKYQPVVDGTYPDPVLSFRISSGWSTDVNAVANWAVVKPSKRIRIGIGYGVFIPGQLDSLLASIQEVFGPKCPNKVALMLDVESGADFAGPGDHSAEANRWLAALAEYAGSPKRVIAYANHYDFDSCWPGLDPSVKRITAAYSTNDPGSWGWQYAGGDPRWPSPAGYPRSAPPFGSRLDCNVVHSTVHQMKLDLGLPVWHRKPPVPDTKPPTPTHKVYKVKPNDSLLAIANRFNVGWHQLVRWNQKTYPSLVAHPDLIQIGWVLRVSK